MANVFRGTARERSISLNTLRLHPPIRPVQELHRVENPNAEASLLEPLLDLERAAGVSAHDHLGAALLDPLELAVQELLGEVWVEEIVDPGASATEVRFLELDELKSRNRLQDRPRFLPDLLAMGEVACIVVRDGALQRLEMAVQWNLGQELGDISHLLAEGVRPLGVDRVGMEQLPVFLHDRAAARRVDDDDVNARPLEDVDRLPRHLLGLFPFPLVDKEGAAALLIPRNHDLVAVLAQDPGRRSIHLREKEALDAAGEQPRPPTPLTLGRDYFRQVCAQALVGDGGKQGLHLPQAAEEAQDPRGPDQLLEAGPLVEPEEAGHGAQAPEVGEGMEDEIAEPTIGRRILIESIDLAPGRFHQEAKLDARRASRLTGAAEEAEVHVLDEIVGDAALPFRRSPYEPDPPTRTIHLVAEDEVGRTRGKTKAAVDAVEREFGVGGIDLIERAFRDLARRQDPHVK